ncbi:HAMP domain-containing sensor histidine kinase [Rubellicoccus peritrichatus]|uniref:histidine kinase n=1 Tax=Rubellicoccus peritrichatus TaxID=3080537 RepID=A0AAQ3QUX7_9BACT|nr:HAMP domain-containing sensor histidine kinase [Puniceicoccus sp. CR14]WOO40277.1 HAMP domain-containing sensor histidine kinase [Puniceicoccus sp. CR14]
MPLSLKWKIQLWYSIILGVVLFVLGVGFYFYEKSQRLAVIDQQLDQKIHPLIGPFTHFERTQKPGLNASPERQQAPRNANPTTTIVREFKTLPEPQQEWPEGWRKRISTRQLHPSGSTWPGPLNKLARPHIIFEEFWVPKGFYAGAELKSDPNKQYTSSNFPDIELPSELTDGFFDRFRDSQFREIYHETETFRVLIGLDLTNYYAGLTLLKLQLTAALSGIFILGLSVGYFLVTRSIKPLIRIEEASEKIAQGQLSARIPEGSRSDANELTKLATHLNRTFTKMESLFHRQIRFTADASHELRTPLTTLIAQIEYGLKQPQIAKEYAHVLSICGRSAYRIEKITEQLIELSRYDSGRVEMEFEEIALDSLLISLSEELTPFVKDQGCHLVTDFQAGPVVCDPFRLEQVITNLVNNAIQHNKEPITITIHSKIMAEAFSISVIDDGKGIQPGNLDKLFDRFFQENASRANDEKRHNFGLGLAISQAIVEAHDGTIRVSSKPAESTVFEIWIPHRSSAETDKY